jgi:hypothetical protein
MIRTYLNDTNNSYKLYRHIQSDIFIATPQMFIYRSRKAARITFQTACKFPDIACRVQPRVIHLIQARWQIATNLLSRASVTVGRRAAAPCHTHRRRCAYCANLLGYRLTPRNSNGVQEIHFGKCNVPKCTTSHEDWRKHVRFWMNELNIAGRLPRLRQRKCVCQIGAVSHKIFVKTVP